MLITAREFWTLAHGMGFGALFLLAFSGGMVALYSLRPDWLSHRGMIERIRLLKIGTVLMAVVSWLTVITGTYMIYPWYRAKPPEGAANLLDYPRSFLLSDPNLTFWHTFGMEWKEHIAWFSPILATAVAFIVWHFASQIAEKPKLRSAVITFYILAFSAAAIAGGLGAFITKKAPLV